MSNARNRWVQFLKSQFTQAAKSAHLRQTVDDSDLLFRRKTNRYAPKGTISSNKGYLKVARNEITGRFESIK